MDPKQLAANHKLRALLSATKTGEVNKIASSIANKFSERKYLRVLDLCKTIFEMSLTENLKNLQILNVRYCQNLKVLPPYLTNFKKLRVLDVSHCGSLGCLLKGLGRLSNLEVLLGFRPTRSCQLEGCWIVELRNLSRLRKLGLHLVWDDEIGDSEVSALVNLQQLQFLKISCFDSHGSNLVDKLDKLYPPPAP
ncbi:unnamed protein product [Dovyalis caffra]|uniref:Disease resistance R13L4/SHOC-2-like LRR domain-containing protein n=1 Tax=Dovyalis caffra TaxID=77055 RepID=A0AAV1SHC6_9ROSI|nr:unnamed protein product [Dovyalis caffra]